MEADSDTDVGPAVAAEAAVGKGPSLVALQQTRLVWDKTRKAIQAELAKLEASILAACQADEDFGVGALDVGVLHGILERLDSRLIDKLDEALNAQDPDQRALLNQQAKAIVDEYMTFVSEDPLMADIDDSGFVPVAVRKTALGSLTLLSSKL